MSRQAALWGLAAMLGIALTAGITWATSQLASQHIGLSSEPISAGVRLAPTVSKSAQSRTVGSRPKRSTSTRPGSTKHSSPATKAVTPVVPTQTQRTLPAEQRASPAPTTTATPNPTKHKSTSSGDDGQDGHTRQSTERPSRPISGSGAGEESAQGSGRQTGEGHRDD
jgi:hypothetical protein